MVAVSPGSRLRSTALVPTCQITMSGCMSITSACSRFIISGASSPPLPRLTTVMSAVGYRRRSCAASRLGYLNSGDDAPYPSVEDDPNATITTGWPAASLLATCGSEPIDLETPFGDRQGTRLKISVADFATSFTLSIARPVRPFCAAGLARSTAATLPAPAAPVVGEAPVVDEPAEDGEPPVVGAACGLAASALAASDLAASDLVASDLVASDLALPPSA